MAAPAAKVEQSELARSERILPGIWRLRMPCPWPGVPHVNAFTVAAEGGFVLFDTGVGGEGGLRQLELALAQAGLELTDARLVACTHAHADHYGLAGPVVDAAGCELWMHPAWEHIRASIEDPDRALECRIEIARQSGVPTSALERYEATRRGADPLVDRIVAPDRELVAGVEIETDLGTWQVHETPGHAPSHVVFHQPDRELLISGDHLLGRVAPYFDYGHTPDPVAEYLDSLDQLRELDVQLCLAGHGRPFRGVPARVAANHALIDEHLGRIRAALRGTPKPAFETVAALLGPENVTEATGAYGLQLVLAYLDHLGQRGEAVPVEGSDPRAWRLAD